MIHEGRGVIRLGDRTDHGGRVITATSTTVAFGIVAALEGNMTYCPQCLGTYAITPDRTGAKHIGTPYAYDGDRTACGARLITSLK